MHLIIKRPAFAAVILATLMSSGCIVISRKTHIPTDQQLLPAQSRTRSELLQDLDERSQSISSLTAKVLLDVASGRNKSDVLTEYRQTQGILIVDRPKQVRIRVLAPVVSTTVVDMVSDGSQYRVSVPITNKFLIGDATAPPTSKNTLLNLRPQHILDALFVDTRAYDNNPQVVPLLEEATSGRIRYYVIQFVDVAGRNSRLLEKIWVDRTNLQVTRKQMFMGDGRVETDVQYSGYLNVAGTLFPQVISIERPVEDYSLRLTFQPTNLRMNEKLASDAFQLERPAGSELVQADNPGPRP